MTFGYFAPAPAAMPVALPDFRKRRKASKKRSNTSGTAKKAA